MEWRFPREDWSEVDRRVGLPTDDKLRWLAKRIDAEHRRLHGDGDKMVEDHRLIGLMGERHIARCLELPMDLSIKPYGNARQNLVLSTGAKVDVITRSLLRNRSYPDLTRKVKARGKPDILVLVVWHGFEMEPEIGGWIREKELMAHGTIRTFRSGIENRCLPIGSLYPFWELVLAHDSSSRWADPFNWHIPEVDPQPPPPEPKPDGPTQASLF